MSDTKRKVFIIIVLILVLLFGVGQFFAYSNLNNNSTQNNSAGQSSSSAAGANGTNSQTPSATQVAQFTPPAITSSTPIESGSCFASSIAAPYRGDAWRCSVGNAISDPCFSILGTHEVFCGAQSLVMGTGSGFVVKLTKALPKTAPAASSTASSTTGDAWLVQLADGTVCSPFTGTRPFSATGEVATYACNGTSTGETMIFGDINAASATWYAEVGSLSTATSTYPPVIASSSTVPVAAAVR
jgi:hypothetical protein